MNTLTWLAWLIAALVVAGLTTNPLYLLLALLGATLVALACHRDLSTSSGLARAYRLFFLAGFVLWVGYVIFSVVTVGGARGRTIIAELPTLTLPALLGGITLGGPIAAEDLVWGAVRGLRIWTLLAIFGAFNVLVNHYRLLRLAPRSFFHAGLAITIAISFVPQTLRAIATIVESQRVRGHRFRGPRSYLALVAPLLANSLEQSIQLAEALDARGYGRTRPDDRHVGRRQAVLLGGLLLVGLGVFGWLYYGSFVSSSAVGLPYRLASAALMLVGATVLGLALRSLGRLVTRTTYRRERWRRRDSAVLAASIACAAGWIGLWLVGGRLPYNPYPIITLPAFDPIAGALAALLATPALFGPNRSEGRARTKPRHASRRASSPAQRESRLDPATSIHVPEK
jgi:energy-coupling factor transport system permease protein